jgi:glycerophosphoryl diester phosphodiesterase
MATLAKLCFSMFIIFVTAITSIRDTMSSVPVSFDVQGHRGCRGIIPENTIPAMIAAVDLGVQTLEMDIVFSKDSVALLSHEPFFNHEITTLPDGDFIQEAEEKQYNIYRMNFNEVQKYDVGLKPHPRFPGQQKIRVSKPSLASVIDSVENYTSHQHLRKVFYNIETKTQPATDDMYHPAPGVFVERLMKLINEKGIAERVIIQSFDFRTLQYLHQYYPAVKTAMLIEDNDKRTLDQQLQALGFTPTIYAPYFSLVTSETIHACHAKKMQIIPWTVNDKKKVNELKGLGADGVITDFPDLL